MHYESTSLPCKHILNRLHLQCRYCGTRFWRARSQTADPDNAFCSRRCFQANRRSISLAQVLDDHTLQTAGCWFWTGTIHADGYGRVKVARKQWVAHRLAWTVANGPIPAGLLVCHHCDIRRCVRLDHLFLGAPADNSADMVAKGRQAKGERHGFALHPERRARGERSRHTTHPELRPKGTRNGRARLSDEQVRTIRRMWLTGGVTQPELGAQFGVTRAMISHIVTGRAWTHLL